MSTPFLRRLLRAGFDRSPEDMGQAFGNYADRLFAAEFADPLFLSHPDDNNSPAQMTARNRNRFNMARSARISMRVDLTPTPPAGQVLRFSPSHATFASWLRFNARMLTRFYFTIARLSASAYSASGYVDITPSLGRIVNESRYIVLIQVEKVSREKARNHLQKGRGFAGRISPGDGATSA